ncbi:hypothetical protein LJ737_14225 [Hymenobacter sp. 15J16-1T3B]|uniref:hypothetical protein n=1 Tax=Hymenobacter sp. 15J16-1T3B TaxID=2886941 RepID=UPI001D1140F1|nr:hypothetical protein [Hymenobacter sp. 15J16-1T3B]MCC3158402.1 hypothetical protein [Hymenobacter sp. 15J16-1T3B]
MTAPSFHALGFSPVTDSGQGRPTSTFFNTWLYRHDQAARDGSHLFLALPFGIPRWRLSMLPWPLAHQDVVQDLAIDDLPGLQRAVDAFFTTHGGRAEDIPAPKRWKPVGFPHEATR